MYVWESGGDVVGGREGGYISSSDNDAIPDERTALVAVKEGKRNSGPRKKGRKRRSKGKKSVGKKCEGLG